MSRRSRRGPVRAASVAAAAVAVAGAPPGAPAAPAPPPSIDAFGPDVIRQVETAPGEKPRYRVSARSAMGVVPSASNYIKERSGGPVVSPFDAASQSDVLPYVQNIGPNDISRHMRMVVSQARQLYRNMGDVRSALKALANDVVGTGPRINPRLPGMKKVLKRWSRECDASGLRNLGGFLRQAYLAKRVDGEVFIRMRPRRAEDGLSLPLQLEALELDHVPWEWTRWAPNGNRIINGIELDKLNRRVNFWMTPFHPADFVLRNLSPETNLPQPVPAGNVLYLGNPERLAGQRSESSLVAGVLRAHHLGIFEDAQLTKQTLSSCYVGTFRRLPEDGGSPLPNERDTADKNSAMLRSIPLEPGILAELPYGTTLEFNDPPDAGPNYDGYVRNQRQYLAMCTDSSYEDYSGDWRGVNDRSWKAGQVKRRVFIDSERADLEFQFMDPLYERLVDLAIATGKVKRPKGWSDEDLYAYNLVWPGSKNPNQFQEWNAWVIAVTNGLVSRDEAIEANGGDPYEVDQRNAEGLIRAEELGLHYPVYAVKPPTGLKLGQESAQPDSGPGAGAAGPGAGEGKAGGRKPGGDGPEASPSPAAPPAQPGDGTDPAASGLDLLRKAIREELRDLLAQRAAESASARPGA